MLNLIHLISHFASKTFAVWVLLVAFGAFLYPDSFLWLQPFISLLLGLVMLGMGMTLSFQHFSEVFRHPKGVLIGVVSQFSCMPLLAYGLAKGFQLPPEIAIGVILVGACPGGTASNVMTFLAKGNIALSVTITSVSTLLAPLLTPFILFVFAREWLEVSALSMFWSVAKIVLFPILLGLVLQFLLKERVEKTTQFLPLVSVTAIVLIVGAVVADSKQQILQSGLLIFLVVAAHNLFGYLLGFFIAKCCKLSYDDQKAISIEVGMQSSALSATLASTHFTPLTVVPSAIFSVWHNISGPLLATFWSRRIKHPTQKQKEAVTIPSLADTRIINQHFENAYNSERYATPNARQEDDQTTE